MTGKKRLAKKTDYETSFRCGGGTGILREEVWIDADGGEVRYNLAFLLPHRFGRDNGRVLAFDNAHGAHERHYLGVVTIVPYEGYLAVSERFFREADELRRHFEDENIR